MAEPDTIKFSTALTIGGMQLKNRVIMSPMTRDRATMDLVPTGRDADVSMLVYYEQRASAGEVGRFLVRIRDLRESFFLPLFAHLRILVRLVHTTQGAVD